MELTPLQQSFAATQIERELFNLFEKLYSDALEATDDEINVYGSPHLGSIDLITRLARQDGLAILRDGDEEKMRYIYKAWRYLNPERGLHLLRAYVRVLFGEGQRVEQLYQKADQPYPLFLRSAEEIVGSENLYFLTSRVLVDLDASVEVPDRIIKALKTVMAARLLLDIRVSKYAMNTLELIGLAGATVVGDFYGDASVYTFFYNGARNYDGTEQHDGILNPV